MQTATAARVINEVQGRAETIKNDAPQRFPEAASNGDTWRQGDLYIEKLGRIPDGAERVAFRAQLAQGDTQGSRHCLDSNEGVKMYARKDATALEGPVFETECERTVEHPEHGNVILPAGIYGITYQRDLDQDERERRVAD